MEITVRIFISYSSKYRDICERLQLALEADGRHEVFVDRSQLVAGKPFDETLREGIDDCDLLLFLVSPESVALGSYALAEMDIAKARWHQPGGHVLPVKVAPTPKEAIPPYLCAVTILEPQGDLVMETVAAVDAVRRPGRPWRLFAMLAGIALAGGLGLAGYTQWQKQRLAEAQATTLAATAQQLCESRDHALAWQRYDEAIARYPDHSSLRQAREDCGMRWLREIRVREGKETFTDIVNRVLPILAEGATNAKGQRAADLRAHMGWANFLRIREGARGLAPQAQYQKALVEDASNVYAHAMWAHNIMFKGGSIESARQHFDSALASGRERSYVRELQFAAMLSNMESSTQIEAARVAGEMRKSGEEIDERLRERLWTYVYSAGLLSESRRMSFMAGMRDPDNPATFRWLYPENRVREDRRNLWRYFMASLEQAAGERDAALARYEALRSDIQPDRLSRLLPPTLTAIKQLRRP
jgi:tetratricopeptide (TPR) repeat protein